MIRGTRRQHHEAGKGREEGPDAGSAAPGRERKEVPAGRMSIPGTSAISRPRTRAAPRRRWRWAWRRSALSRTGSTPRIAGRVLLIFQAMDAAGKDGAIKHVMSGVNPQGCQVASFKGPSAEDLDHDYLWRCQSHLPERGRIGIFNRSYYEEVLVVRVHPEILAEAEDPAGARRQGRLRGPLPGHPGLRALPERQRHPRPQVLPPRLAQGTEAAFPRAARGPGEELEVLRPTSASAATGRTT